jgi:hypothetical protein
LAAANPLAQIDEKSDIPPQGADEDQGDAADHQAAAGAVIQGPGRDQKYGLQQTEIKEEGATRRALMKETNDAHEREITSGASITTID